MLSGLLVLGAVATASATTRIVMEEGLRTVPSRSWAQLGRCDASEPLTLHIMMALTPGESQCNPLWHGTADGWMAMSVARQWTFALAMTPLTCTLR
jgi:hypothetical protein